MPKLWKILSYATGTEIFSYSLGVYYFNLRIQTIPPEKLPKGMSIQKITPTKGNYIPYVDTFCTTVNDDSTKNLQERFINGIGLRSALKGFNVEIISSQQDQGFSSFVYKWNWKNPKLVDFFNQLANYGYPYRLQSGGYHELYIERTEKTDFFNIFFASAHEYEDFHDSKILPGLFLHLHTTYAKVLLLWSYSRSH